MMNHASETQLMAVAQNCSYFDSVISLRGFTSGPMQNYSCRNCKNWNGERCVINMFDKVIVDIDQT